MKCLLHDDRGIADVGSILFAVLITALAMAMAGITLYKAVPWAQDTLAKESLRFVVEAEKAHFTTAATTSSGAYQTKDELLESGHLKGRQPFCIVTSDSNKNYDAYLQSGSGKVFTAGSTNSAITTFTGAPPASCDFSTLEPPTTETPAAHNGETVLGWASHNLETMKAEEQEFGVRNGMLSTYVDFVSYKGFPADFAAAAAEREASLLIAWEPYDMDAHVVDQAEFKPTNITKGNYDTYITNWLKEAQTHASKETIMVRFAPEMNDSHRPWSISTNGGNTAAEYIAMWRHVYDIKEEVAPDVIFMWNPLVAGATVDNVPTTITSMFPGENYVDLIGLDGYNWADVQNPALGCNWQSYADVFSGAITEVKTLAPNTPWGIAEAGSVPKPESFFTAGGACYDAWGSWVYQWPEDPPHYLSADDWITQAGWNKAMMRKAHDDGAMFVNVFNVVKETDWRMNSTEAGTKILREAMENPLIIAGDQDSDRILKAGVK